MSTNKQTLMKRNRVVLNKPSLELLIELNGFAKVVGATVVIGLDELNNPSYIIEYSGIHTERVTVHAKTKEEVLEKLIHMVDKHDA